MNPIQKFLLHSLMSFIVVINLTIIIGGLFFESKPRSELNIVDNNLVQKLVAYVPFCITAIYCVIYEISKQNSSIFEQFCEFYTFLGFPMTTLHFVNFIINFLKDLFSLPSNFVVYFPEVFGEALIESLFKFETIVTILNFASLVAILFVYNCLVIFNPLTPILVLILLYGIGILCQISFLSDDKSETLNNDQLQFITSLSVQIMIVCILFIVLHHVGKYYGGLKGKSGKLCQAEKVQILQENRENFLASSKTTEMET